MHLYYVEAYSPRNNLVARIILTADDSLSAGKSVTDYLEGDWKANGISFVTTVTEEVWVEV
jgi:hypothetical protein